MWQKLNNLYVGLATGLILPTILYFILIYPKINQYSILEGYYHELLLKALPLLLTRCIFPNALLFFLLIWRNMLQAAKGILIITAILTAILVIVNFIL